MKHIKLDSILLFVLLIPFIMSYRLGPGDTPYWLFGLIFLGLFTYIVLDLLRLKDSLYFRIKQTLLWLLIIGVIGSAFVSAIIVRHQTHPVYMIHDIVLQQESAIRFLLDGKNPYAVTYFGTPLEQWHYSDNELNPALYHFVMQPFYLLFALPFYFLSNHSIGYFDGRIPLLFLFILLLFVGGKLIKNPSQKLLFIVILAFNPAVLPYTLEGRSDIFMFTFLFIGLFLLHKKHYFWAGVPVAFSFAVKQSAWPLLPFYIAFLYFKTKSITKTFKNILPLVIVFLTIVLPFFLWDKKAFLDSTIFYLSGKAPHSYPISGYGLGTVLHQMGLIKDVNAYYPFIIWQAIIGIPLLIVTSKYLKSRPGIGRMMLVYGIFLFVFWYFSRYFNNSHLGYLSIVFITAYFWPKDK